MRRHSLCLLTDQHFNTALKARLMLETYRRMRFGVTVALSSAAMVDAGYCLDAPDNIPCGAMIWIDCGEGLESPWQIEVRRG